MRINSILISLNLAALVRNLYGVVRGKTVTIFFGIYGVGVLGQVLSFFSIQNRVVLLGIDTILINKLGELKKKNDINQYLSIVYITFSFLLIINFLFFVICFVFQDDISRIIFNENRFSKLFILLLSIGPIYSISSFFEIITQANSDFKSLAFGRNAGSFIGIATIIPLIYFFKYYGIIISLEMVYIISGGYFIYKNINIIRAFSTRYFVSLNEKLRPLYKLGFTDISRKMIVYSSIFFFRIIIVQLLGIEKSGYFQAIWSISLYPEILFGAFISYYYPTISSTTNFKEVKNVISENFIKFNYLMFPIILMMIAFSGILLNILFDENFMVMTDKLRVLIFLKYLDGIYLIISITFLGKNFLRYFLVSEFVKYSALLASSMVFIPLFGIMGAIVSIASMQLISLIIIFYFMIKSKYIKIDKKAIKESIVFIVILGLAVLTIYSSRMVDIFVVIISIILFFRFIEYKKYYLSLISVISFGKGK